MKIVHVITRMVHGGAQLNTLMCAFEQARRGHDVTLITGTESGPEGSLLQAAREGPIRVLEVPSMVRRIHPWLDLRAFFAVHRLLAEGGYDVVHTHTSKAGILARVSAWALRSPVVIHTPHGHIFHGYFPPLKERVFIWIERLCARLCHKMIMLTEGDFKDHLAHKIGPPGLFMIVPSGVDLKSFGPAEAASAPPASAEDRVLVGSVMRLVPIKGVFDLLEAWRIVMSEHSACHLAICGDGPLRQEIEARITALNLERDVTLLGHKDPVCPFLQTLKVFVLPSHNEGMGRAVVEAMACALPIVATRTGGLPDLVAEGVNGLLVSPQEPTELARALLELIRDPDKARRMGAESLDRVRDFSAEVMYERLETLYQELQHKE